MSDHTPVFYETLLVGMIHTDTRGSCFTYDESWLSRTGSFQIAHGQQANHRRHLNRAAALDELARFGQKIDRKLR